MCSKQSRSKRGRLLASCERPTGNARWIHVFYEKGDRIVAVAISEQKRTVIFFEEQEALIVYGNSDTLLLRLAMSTERTERIVL